MKGDIFDQKLIFILKILFTGYRFLLKPIFFDSLYSNELNQIRAHHVVEWLAR